MKMLVLTPPARFWEILAFCVFAALLAATLHRCSSKILADCAHGRRVLQLARVETDLAAFHGAAPDVAASDRKRVEQDMLMLSPGGILETDLDPDVRSMLSSCASVPGSSVGRCAADLRARLDTPGGEADFEDEARSLLNPNAAKSPVRSSSLVADSDLAAAAALASMLGAMALAALALRRAALRLHAARKAEGEPS